MTETNTESPFGYFYHRFKLVLLGLGLALLVGERLVPWLWLEVPRATIADCHVITREQTIRYEVLLQDRPPIVLDGFIDSHEQCNHLVGGTVEKHRWELGYRLNGELDKQLTYKVTIYGALFGLLITVYVVARRFRSSAS